jgi:hypothetical protein
MMDSRMVTKQLEEQNLIRQRMAEKETIRQKVGENGNRWTEVCYESHRISLSVINYAGQREKGGAG